MVRPRDRKPLSMRQLPKARMCGRRPEFQRQDCHSLRRQLLLLLLLVLCDYGDDDSGDDKFCRHREQAAVTWSKFVHKVTQFNSQAAEQCSAGMVRSPGSSIPVKGWSPTSQDRAAASPLRKGRGDSLRARQLLGPAWRWAEVGSVHTGICITFRITKTLSLEGFRGYFDV